MKSKHWLDRAWLVALGTFLIALLPVMLAFAAFRSAAERSQRELFATATGLVHESLRLATARHVNILQLLRAQLSSVPDPAGRDGTERLRERDWQTRVPHWRAFAFVESAPDAAVVRWCECFGGAPPVKEGDNLAADPKLDELFSHARGHPFQQSSAAWNTNQMAVVGAVMDARRSNIRGFLVGWLDLDGLCRDPQLPLVEEGALVLTPMDVAATAPADSSTLRVNESGVDWQAAVARGPKFAMVFGRPTPWLVLGGGGICALLLSALAGFVAHSRGQRLRAAELNAALEAEREVGRMRSQFVSSVSHEFRTPLSVILASADLLESYADKLSPERRAKALGEIQDSTRHMTRMIEEVLLLGRMESNRVPFKPAPLEVENFCREIARDVETAMRRRNPIQVRVADGLGLPILDAGLLRSILENLLSNAVKYSNPGAPVSLEAGDGKGTVVFTVRDEGIGIPSADLPRLGRPFHRGGNVGGTPGTGLGLAIVQRSVALHGGSFHIESEEARGTKAIVVLPCQPCVVAENAVP